MRIPGEPWAGPNGDRSGDARLAINGVDGNGNESGTNGAVSYVTKRRASHQSQSSAPSSKRQSTATSLAPSFIEALGGPSNAGTPAAELVSSPLSLPVPSSSAAAAADSNSPTAILDIFQDRWNEVDKTIRELPILQPRASKGRGSGSVGRKGSSATTNTNDMLRLSTTSSLLGATYEFMGSSEGSSQRSSGHGQTTTTADWRNTTHSSNITSPPTSPSVMTTYTGSAASTHSAPKPGSIMVPSRAYDAQVAYDTPSSVNGPPLTPAQMAKKERKRAEKAEREAAVKLVQERAKAEKAARKRAGSGSRGGVGGSTMLFPGLLGGSLLGPKLSLGSAGVTDDRPSSPTPTKSKDKGKSKDKDPRRPPPLQTPDFPRHERDRGISQQLSQGSNTSPTAVADRARDMLFGLSAMDYQPTPSLPSLQQLSPHALVPPDSVLPHHRRQGQQERHPYAFSNNDEPSPTSPPPGEHGLWESLFDQSQQSYKFHPQQGASVSPEVPSPIRNFNNNGRYEDDGGFARTRASAEMMQSTSQGSTRSGRHRSHQQQSSNSHQRRSDHSQHRQGGRPSSAPQHSHARTMSHPTPPTQQQYVRFDEPLEPEEMYYEELHAPPAPAPEQALDPLTLDPLYVVICVHPFHPPSSAWHRGLPFLHLETNDVVDVLLEDGHPSTHPDLPIYIDDGDDCMLVGRDERGAVGWCLASFVMPFV